MRTWHWILLTFLVSLVGCDRGAQAPAPAPVAATTPTTGPSGVDGASPSSVPPTEELSHGGVSNGEAYSVRYRTIPPEIPVNEPFSIEVRVADLSSEPPVPAADVQLVADAAMPQHNHGMIRKPEVVAHGDGSFTVTGMLFHMSGEWELYFDITRGAVTERAQFDVELD